jgi:hypothetical protein
MIDALDLAILDGDQATTLWAGLAGVPTLQTARKDYPGVCQNLLASVDMTKSPVLVILCSQIVELAGSVVRVALASI